MSGYGIQDNEQKNEMTRLDNTPNIKIQDVVQYSYNEIFEKSQPEENVMSEQQTFKHLIEYKGHTYLIETTFEFQPMSFDPKGGYVPYLKVIKARKLDLEEK